MTKEQIYQIISSSEFSSSLKNSTMEKLAEVMKSAEYSASTNLYMNGDAVSKFIFIYSGKCDIVDKDNHVLRQLNQGDFFGLISLFTKSAKNYSLITSKITTTLELKKSDLDELTSKYSDLKEDLLQLVNKRLFNPEINKALQTIAKGVNQQTIDEKILYG